MLVESAGADVLTRKATNIPLAEGWAMLLPTAQIGRIRLIPSHLPRSLRLETSTLSFKLLDRSILPNTLRR